MMNFFYVSTEPFERALLFQGEDDYRAGMKPASRGISLNEFILNNRKYLVTDNARQILFLKCICNMPTIIIEDDIIFSIFAEA
jgi:hypothetical protein